MIKLHLGCGKRDFGSDWIHIDKIKYNHVKYTDVTYLNFSNNTVDVIYASHLLEYFDRTEAYEILSEWIRVLKPSTGILRLAVPDFEIIAKLYVSGFNLTKFLGPLYGKMGIDEFIYHKTAYDFFSLKSILKDVGFSQIRKYDWHDTEHAHIDDHSQAYIPHMDKENGTLISLNVEASYA